MKIGFLTSGGMAPCLTSSISCLIQNYQKLDKDFQYMGYLNGYYGLLKGKSMKFNFKSNDELDNLKKFGGSILGNSRVKLTNVEDCVKNNYIKKNQKPIEVAAQQLMRDQINILHTIGGDDTNSTAADLVLYLESKGHDLTVVGLPKTIDNDVFPILKTLGADTAAEQGAIFFENIVNENTTSRRQLIIHEIMGRNCGWLTAATAKYYRDRMNKKTFYNSNGLYKKCWDIHAIYIPEMNIEIKEESNRLKNIMDKYDCVNIFLSEGAGIENIVKELELSGEPINRDAFGHLRLDEINPGKWYAEKISNWTNAKKILVQKSGYFCRSSYPNQIDMELIEQISKEAVNYAIKGINGVVGLSDRSNQIECIDFKSIRGGKPFDFQQEWFEKMLIEIGQKK